MSPFFIYSEEGNQAAAKRTFGFIRAYNEKIVEREARMLRQQHDFRVKEEGNQAAAKRTFD